MEPIKVVVHGAAGKMGQEVIRAVCADPETKLVGAVDAKTSGDTLTLADGSKTLFSTDLVQVVSQTKPDVIVDFSTAKAVMPLVHLAAEKKVNLVIGTTGLPADQVKEIEQEATANKIGIVIASNFALGAVLMMYLAKTAAKYLDYAEIIELHHDKKTDAPSGTALTTARGMAAARGKPFVQPASKEKYESRGQVVEGITLHSVRLPGLLAHQEVLFGAAGQTLSIRHDTISRECYMPGVLMAIKEVTRRKGLINGLDNLLGLGK
ncbi:MAG: 4-hydroxy-tetrahydrodipicolinate reductase [Dehalococcoidales bacterium]|nr:4-hydroxy-tetrahydrodipicolinate reductase [Dehalococcoidales bacterium]